MLTCVADPKAWPKSMPTISPFLRFIMKLDKCRSPMPSTYWHMEIRACVEAHLQRRTWNASGEVLILWKARLENTCIYVFSSYTQQDYLRSMIIITPGKRETFTSTIKQRMLYYNRICIHVFGNTVMGTTFYKSG